MKTDKELEDIKDLFFQKRTRMRELVDKKNRTDDENKELEDIKNSLDSILAVLNDNFVEEIDEEDDS